MALELSRAQGMSCFQYNLTIDCETHSAVLFCNCPAGYQAVKKVLVQGHPAVILTAVGLAAAAPSYKCMLVKPHLHSRKIRSC